jgi:hypothetical protein
MEGWRVSRGLKLTLIIIGIFLLLVALSALIYALSPVSIVHEQATVAPTLFVQPLVTP